ncbi:MAG: twin transmembrane helix small protein [Alphaproteobacteria bacterium]|nr:twin transmembrane helix small protein [Alphaproteobacteria bacterium]MCY4320525.1 twin transmembrane helix small protein [Alphaproteobacteria bacterium]
MSFLIPIFLAAVALVLFTGIFGMVRGGAFNRKYGNRLMQLRVGLQFLAIVLIAAAALLAGS